MSRTDDCGCCPPATGSTPSAEINAPGLDDIVFRAGTHSTFKRRLLARLAAQPALARLSTRADDDPAIALLDAWACTLDVLTFYQERIANEGFLRTAKERRSVLELARAIGYELRPGVAASTDLAFTLETAPGAPKSAVIAQGTKVQSVPAQDQRAQIFETLDAIEARGAWNALRVQSTASILPLSAHRATLYLQGQSTRVQPGDALLVVGDDPNWDFCRVHSVRTVAPEDPTPDGSGGYTIVTLDRGLERAHKAPNTPRVYALRTRANLFGYNAADWRAMPLGLRGQYLGLHASDADEAKQIAAYPQWPGFTPADLSDPPLGIAAGTGLRGAYYAGQNFEEQRLTRIDSTVDFDWGANSPAPNVPADHFSVRWSGWVETQAGGNYIFSTVCDNGARLWVDGKLLIKRWTDSGAVQNDSAPVLLAPQRKYDIRLEYYENQGAASSRLLWTPPGEQTAVIPSAQLYPRDIHTLKLDAVYPKITEHSWVVLATAQHTDLYRVESKGETACADFAQSAKVTWLKVSGENLYEHFNQSLRETAVFGEAEELAWAQRPIAALVTGEHCTLTSLEPDLQAGQRVAVSGLTPDKHADPSILKRLASGEEVSLLSIAKDSTGAMLRFIADAADLFLPLAAAAEVVTLHATENVVPATKLAFIKPLRNAYLPQSVRINANIAPASHGDSRQMRVQPEVLGSGNGSAVFQSFNLKQAPLTYVPAATPSGAVSTLEVRVAGVTWDEAASFYGTAPTARIYVTRLADDGTVTVRFGDGITGARLPSGTENVQAVYRVGIGAEGNLEAGQLSLLLTQQLGVKSVSNAQPASGGTDPQHLGGARRNAPLTVLTLDRIVSLSDFEDFAAAFTGIGKAQAVWLWDGEQRLVHVTVAAAAGATLAKDAPLFSHLSDAMDAARPPHQKVVIATGDIVRLPVKARLRMSKGYHFEAVGPAVMSALRASFGFDARHFGQPISGSELVAVMQAVPGVDYVVLISFGSGAQTANLESDPVGAQTAHWDGTTLKPAELLLVDADAIELAEITK